MGVWADEVTQKYDFEDGVALFSADSRVTVAVEDDADLKSKVVSLLLRKMPRMGIVLLITIFLR